MPSPPQSTSNPLTRPPARLATVLGYGGLLPFAALALAAWLLDGPRQVMAVFALLAYSASILSFLGAIHWGLAMRDPLDPPAALLAWGVAPSLLAWLALLCGASAGLMLVAAGLWACWVVDRSVYPRLGLQGWLAMRLRLTAIASLSCVAGALAIIR